MAALGGGAGLALGWWGTTALLALQPAGMLPVTDIALSWSVLGYACVATLFCAALFGVAPVLWTRRRVPADVKTGVCREKRTPKQPPDRRLQLLPTRTP